MKQFLKSTKGRITLGVVVLLLGFLSQSVKSGNLKSIGASTVGLITKPFTATANFVSDTVGGFLGLFQGGRHYQKENEKMAEELAQLKIREIEFEEMKKENEAYREQLEIKEENPSFDMVTAQVTIRNVNEKFFSFKINKGSRHGIAVKNAVMTKEGLVGIVTDVGADFAEVKTILDPSVSVGCLISAERITGIAEGDLVLWKQSKGRIKHIARENDIKNKDKVITSGESNFYPKNLMIGTISEVTYDDDALLMTGVLTPAVDIASVRQVQVITNFTKDEPKQ